MEEYEEYDEAQYWGQQLQYYEEPYDVSNVTGVLCLMSLAEMCECCCPSRWECCHLSLDIAKLVSHWIWICCFAIFGSTQIPVG